jgi:RNA polymerase sigma-70 factor, ECF subfamily
MYDRLNSYDEAVAPSSSASGCQSGQMPTAHQRSDLAERQERFSELMTTVAGKLYSTAFRWGGNHANAEDLVQETHLCAWRNFDRFALGTCFRAWVVQILRFVVWNRRRSAAWRQVTMDFHADESSLGTLLQDEKGVVPLDTDWESAIPDLVDDALKHALDRLTPTQRVLTLWISLGGLSYQECADELGIPVGTVMSRYWRARTKLRQELRRTTVGRMHNRNAK